METNSKNIAIVSYITLIGWVIALIMKNSSNDRSPFTTFHLRQSFGVGGISAIGFMLTPLSSILPLWSFSQILNLLVLVLMIIGILNANAGKEEPLPFVGKFFNEKFTFIQ